MRMRLMFVLMSMSVCTPSAYTQIMVGDSPVMTINTTLGDQLIDAGWHGALVQPLSISTRWDDASVGILTINGDTVASLGAEEDAVYGLRMPPNVTAMYECVWSVGDKAYKRTLLTSGARQKADSGILSLDTGTRVASVEGVTLTYDARWYDTAATMEIEKDGAALVSGVRGEYAWMPESCKGAQLKLTARNASQAEVATETAAFQGEHKPVPNYTVKPTCTTSGHVQNTICEWCGIVLDNRSYDVPALGHDWQTVKPAIEPTCISEGQTAEITCARCGEVKQHSEILPKLDHKSITIPAVEPTATTVGWTAEVFCEKCGICQFCEFIPALGRGEESLRNLGYDDLPPSKKSEMKYDEDGFLIWNGWVFGYQHRKATDVDIPEGIVGIGRDAFADMWDLSGVTLPFTLLYIASNGFGNDYCLDNVIIPEYAEEIGDGAFMNCTEMSAFEFGKGLKRIGNSAFENCISLESVVIQEGLTNLGARAFWGQSRLKSVSLPASLESIGADAFKGSTFITGVTVPTHLMTMQELFPDSYQKIESVVVPEGEGTIMDSMFAGCVGLKTIIIPSSVTNIGASAFANCSALVELGLPDEVTTLGARAFYGCMALKTLSLPRNLTAIADETFAACPMLDSLVIPASVTSLGHKIYSGARIGYYFTANLTAVNFLGDAPGTYSDSYEGMPSALKSYVIKGSRSWYMPGSPTLPPNGWPTTGNARDITYWTPNEFEVTFDGNGGTPETYVSKQITDTTYSLPKSDPVRDGYLFKGWWTEREAGAQIYWNTRVTATKAHTLYAHWKSLVEMITVRFNPNGGTVEPSEKTYPPGVTFGELPVPTRIGHNFVGWYTSQVGGDLVTESTVVSKEHNELYAHWVPITYRVAFDANGGSGTMYDQTHTYNVAQALTANAYYLTGFNFTGWSETRGGAVKYANQQVVENLTEIQGQVVTLYAVWSGAKYSVRFDANGGEGIMANQTHQVGVRLALSKCTFTRKGYSFLGWATTPKGVVEYEDEEEVQNLTMQASATVPLYAVWSPNPYSIAYDANGGTGTMAPTACLYDKEVTIPACGFSKDGYSFTGWATSAEGAVVYTPGQKVLNLTDEAGKVITLFAVWELAGVEAPVFSPADGTVFKGSCTVTLTCPTPGASIYYRIGSKPKATSKYLYSEPFEITETSTVYAFAKLGDTESECVTATYTKGKVITFEEAVKAKGITAFTHGGDAVWGVEEGLGEGDVCVRSGVIIDEQVSWFGTTVQGPGTISFKWKASCEEDYPSHEWDHLAFNIDGAKDDYARLDGVTDWEDVSAKLEAGTHTLRWSYVKDESDAEGEDCGWVDCVTWVADAPAPVPPGGEIVVPEGKTVKEFADEVNKNKAQYLNWPLEGPVSTDYLGYFTAVPKGDAKVEFVLNEKGTNQVVEATTAAKTNTLESVLAKTGTLVIGDPLIGFYYSLKQGSDVTVGDKADLNKLAGRDTLSFPLTTDKSKYFYQSLVTPTPVPTK